jgi:hypothetical protein
LLGDVTDQGVQGLAADANGAAIAGFFNGDLSLPGRMTMLPSEALNVGQDDGNVFLIRFGHCGEVKWNRRLGDTKSNAEAAGVALVPDGHTVVAGSAVGKMVIAPIELTPKGGDDVYVAKFDSLGSTKWALRFGDSAAQKATAMAADDSVVVVGGRYSGDMTPVPVADLPKVTTPSNGFVLLHDANGSYVRAFPIGGSSLFKQPTGLSVTENAIYLVGIAQGGGSAVQVGSLPSETIAAKYISFVVQLDKGGNPKKLKTLSGAQASHVIATSIAVSKSKNVAIGGRFMGTVDFGTKQETSANWDAFVAIYDADLKFLAHKRFDQMGEQGIDSIAFDANEDLWVAGRYQDFIFQDLEQAVGFDVFVASLRAKDLTLTKLWAKRYDDASNDHESTFTFEQLLGNKNRGTFATSAAIGKALVAFTTGKQPKTYDVRVAELMP